MAVPEFQSFFKPLLEFASDGLECSIGEARVALAEAMNLTQDDLAEVLPSGRQTRFDNRVAWAKSYLVQAKALVSPRRGRFSITERGRELLSQGHERIDTKVLNQYTEFVEFHSPHRTDSNELGLDDTQQETPEETLQQAYESIRRDLALEIHSLIMENSPDFFENLVVDLMISLGYGGSRADAGRSVGRSGDGGIDGIINEDRLGLDVIYLQAKRWEGTVGRPEIQKFVGALHGKRARKGVFITTGRFSNDAIKYVSSIDPKVSLIDGRRLAELMIDNRLGVAGIASYEIMRVDSDYFEEG